MHWSQLQEEANPDKCLLQGRTESPARVYTDGSGLLGRSPHTPTNRKDTRESEGPEVGATAKRQRRTGNMAFIPGSLQDCITKKEREDSGGENPFLRHPHLGSQSPHESLLEYTKRH